MSPETIKRVSIRNGTADLRVLQRVLDDFGRDHGLPQKLVNDLQVALDEIASNIVKYSWPDDAPHEFSVTFGMADGVVRVQIDDDGVPFDPLSVGPVPVDPHYRPRPGGLGIPMVRKLVDNIEYSRVGSVNRLTLFKRYR